MDHPDARRHHPCRLPALAVLVGLFLLVGACSSDDESVEGTTATTAIPATVPTGAPPEAPGAFEVGRRTVTIADPDRGGRELVVDAWYPAAPGEEPGSVYQFIPGLEYTSEVAVADAPVAPGTYPVVVYSHGSGGVRFVSAFLTEALASHGIVVVAPDHTGNTTFDAFLGTESPDAQRRIDRPADVTFLLDQVLEPADDGAFAWLDGATDAEQVGIVGHSYGGYTALVAVSGTDEVPADPRIDAAAGLAPYTEPITDAELEAVDVPTLLVSGTADVTTTIEDNTERPWGLIPGRPLIRVDIADAGHQSFTDVCAYREIVRSQPDTAPAIVEAVEAFSKEGCAEDLIDPEQAHRITNRVVTGFFLAELGIDPDAAAWVTPEGLADVPEASVQVRP